MSRTRGRPASALADGKRAGGAPEAQGSGTGYGLDPETVGSAGQITCGRERVGGQCAFSNNLRGSSDLINP